MTIAIVPARGGSKRIPKKNIAPFFGKPLIQWTIDTLLESNRFDEIIISTDDRSIAAAASQFGGIVTIAERRPELADDFCTIQEVVKDVILNRNISPREFVMMVLPTAIFLKKTTISLAIAKIKERDAIDYIIPVQEYQTNPARALKLDRNSMVEARFPENIHTRSQDLEPWFHDSGLFSIASAETWLTAGHAFESKSLAIVLDAREAIDIDTPTDLDLAKWLFSNRSDKNTKT